MLSVRMRFSSSGIPRSPERKVSFDVGEQYAFLLPPGTRQRVELTSPTTTIRPGLIFPEQLLKGKHDPRRLLGVRATAADAEVVIRLRRLQLAEENIAHLFHRSAGIGMDDPGLNVRMLLEEKFWLRGLLS